MAELVQVDGATADAVMTVRECLLKGPLKRPPIDVVRNFSRFCVDQRDLTALIGDPWPSIGEAVSGVRFHDR